MYRATVIILSLSIGLNAAGKAKTNLPISREATILETSSPTEILVRAVGYGTGSKKAAELDKAAEQDARKAAVWGLLYGGSDPLLSNDTERATFDKIAESFFQADNIRQFITWEADYYDVRLRQSESKIKIEKTFKINRNLLQDYLVKQGILPETQKMADIIGMPTIMVLPEKIDARPPLELLQKEPNIKKAAEVIESFLTARQFTVIVPEQQQALQELQAANLALEGESEDYSYLLALAIGSDIYINFNVKVESRKIGSSVVKKGIVGCRAYETTTARLLGTETGYSQERPTADAVVIEEAMNEAIGKVLDRISNYWKSDLQRGVQFKLVVNINQTIDSQTAESIIDTWSELVKKVAKNYKENAVADYTYDVLLWCDPQAYRTSNELYRALRQNYKGYGILQKVAVNRKLLQLNIVEP